ncbi:MAG: DUF2330 domain-containing protein [Polyangiaceae bacterium]
MPVSLLLRRLVFAATLLPLLACLIPSDAAACGGFFLRPALEGERRPSLSYEQTLILFDEGKHREHFIRDVTFNAAGETFGFVVPTPSRPQVDKVKKSPFAALRRSFPFRRRPMPSGAGFGSGKGRGIGLGGGGVTVLEQKKVGSFTAFVLAATDEKALSAWLAKNKLVSTPEADTWLAHYVKMKFFYVALRYDGDKKGAAAPDIRAETMRISFDAPVPYYPYFEPSQPKGVSQSDSRMLELWVASAHAAVPVAAKREGERVTWVKPMAEGDQHLNARESLALALGDEKKWLPEGDLRVQTFIDQKRSREGYGDVLFVARDKRELDAATLDQLKALLPILDPSLVGGGE